MGAPTKPPVNRSREKKFIRKEGKKAENLDVQRGGGEGGVAEAVKKKSTKRTDLRGAQKPGAPRANEPGKRNTNNVLGGKRSTSGSFCICSPRKKPERQR